MLVAIRLQIKVFRHFLQAFITDVLDVLLHEAIVVAPKDSVGANGGFLGPSGDLVGMQVVQAELVDQGFFDLLMHDQIAVDLDLAALVRHHARQVPVDIDGLAIDAVAGQVRDVVGPVELLHSSQDGIQGPIQHQARNVPVRDP